MTLKGIFSTHFHDQLKIVAVQPTAVYSFRNTLSEQTPPVWKTKLTFKWGHISNDDLMLIMKDYQ